MLRNLSELRRYVIEARDGADVATTFYLMIVTGRFATCWLTRATGCPAERC